MAGSVNKVILVGNLGKEPEIHTATSGTKIASLSVATSEAWKDKGTGERKEKTEWHRVVIFGPLADIAEKYLKRGSKVFIQGKNETRKWKDKNNVERYTTEIVVRGFAGELTMLEGKGSGAAPPPHEGYADGDEPPGTDGRDEDRLY